MANSETKTARAKKAPVQKPREAHSTEEKMDQLIKKPEEPQSKTPPAPGDSQIDRRIASQTAGWEDPEQGKLVVAEKDGQQMLARFKVNFTTGPKGGFFTQTTPRGGFTCFEGKVDAWAPIPEMTHRAAAA